MMKFYADDFGDCKCEVQHPTLGKVWVSAKPINATGSIFEQLKRAWHVFTGRAIAVYFHGQGKD